MLCKQFDISLDWISWQCRPKRLKKFLHASDPNERLAMLRAARERGSVTPEGMRMVDEATAHAAATGGRVAVREGVEVEAAMWLEADELATTPRAGGAGQGAEASAAQQPRRACWEVGARAFRSPVPPASPVSRGAWCLFARDVLFYSFFFSPSKNSPLPLAPVQTNV